MQNCQEKATDCYGPLRTLDQETHTRPPQDLHRRSLGYKTCCALLCPRRDVKKSYKECRGISIFTTSPINTHRISTLTCKDTMSGVFDIGKNLPPDSRCFITHSLYNSTDPNDSRYGYTPSKAATIVFVVLFGAASGRSTKKNVRLLSANTRISSSPRSSDQISNVVHAYHRVPLWGHGNGGMGSPVLFELSPHKHDGVHDTVSSLFLYMHDRFNFSTGHPSLFWHRRPSLRPIL